MNTSDHLNRRKDQILAELAALGPMRKGSLNEQFVQTVLQDGTPRQRGPYTIYTYKEQGKTISRRLRKPDLVELYRQQIARFRRFQELTDELARVGQQWADLEATQDDGSKKNSRH
jgi:hypothetical protein